MDVLRDINESKQYDLKEMVCDLSSVFKDIVVIEPKSASPTIQVLAKIPENSTYSLLTEYVNQFHDDDVFVKIGFNAVDNADDIERTVYKYVLGLIKANRTPNIMRYIMSFKCYKYYLKLQKDHTGSINEQIWEKALALDKRVFESLKLVGSLSGTASFVVLERAKGMPLHKLMADTTIALSDTDLLAITFQVTYTLRELTLARVRHNDVHLGNIWIVILPQPEEFIYVPEEGKYYVLNTRYLAKIYDFDRAAFTLPKAPVNERVVKKLCPKLGECANYSSYFDIHTFCYKLNKRREMYPIISTIVDSFILDPDLLSEACCRGDGLLCSPLPDRKCDPNYIPKTYQMRDFTGVLYDTDLFDEFKVSHLELVQLPTEREVPIDTVPNMVFSTNFYVSSHTDLTAIQTANMLLDENYRIGSEEEEEEGFDIDYY
jgi:hypothetical protein